MPAKLKGATNIGDSGLVMLYAPSPSYFVRGARKEYRNAPEVLSKGLARRLTARRIGSSSLSRSTVAFVGVRLQ